MSIENENLSGKVILEVGSRRGGTTRKLVHSISGQSGSQLIVTDVSDRFFQSLQAEFQVQNVQIRFLRTGAQELQGISDGSIDFIVWYYTLCAVNSQAGLAALALKWKFLFTGWLLKKPMANKACSGWARKYGEIGVKSELVQSRPCGRKLC